jgi:nitrite reductase/ring-hydroxylating ferredoxin subunit
MKKFILFISCIAFVVSCKKDDGSQVPNVSVDVYVYLTQPSNSALNSVGNWKYIEGGIKGIVVYHQSQETFTAFDRACPHDYDQAASRIDVDSVNLSFIDRNCGSKFNLLTGNVDQGPATHPMRQYTVDYDGVSILHIHN